MNVDGNKFASAIPQEWIGQKVKVLTAIALGNEIKGILSEIGTDYIVVAKDIINVGYVVKIRRA
ncbi:hypothetical protein ACFLX1_01245 [Chloroflexota bacterium]